MTCTEICHFRTGPGALSDIDPTLKHSRSRWKSSERIRNHRFAPHLPTRVMVRLSANSFFSEEEEEEEEWEWEGPGRGSQNARHRAGGTEEILQTSSRTGPQSRKAGRNRVGAVSLFCPRTTPPTRTNKLCGSTCAS